jgi:hypothetical protein
LRPTIPFPRSASLFREKNGETSNVRVGFATFDKQIHFYNIKVSDEREMVFAEQSTSLLSMILVLPGGK